MKTAQLDVPRWAAGDEAKKWGAGKTLQDKMIAKAFRAIARGKKVIDLYESMTLAGVDSLGRPQLAIARADSTSVNGMFGQYTNGMVHFRSDRGSYRTNQVSVPAAFMPGSKHFDARAKTPICPPPLRQAKMERLWILFDAEWERVTKDPLLLEPLGGALYRVVGHWDLTAIEQAVLRGRR